MPNKIRRWRLTPAARARLSRASSIRALPGWLLLFLDVAHRIHFALGLMSVGVAAFLEQWAWLIGVVWLLWAIGRPDSDELARVRDMERLRPAIVASIWRLERLCMGYETAVGDKAGNYKLHLEACRTDLHNAIGDLVGCAERALPRESRPAFMDMLRWVHLDILGPRHWEWSGLAGEIPPDQGIRLYLERLAARDEPPQADGD